MEKDKKVRKLMVSLEVGRKGAKILEQNKPMNAFPRDELRIDNTAEMAGIAKGRRGKVDEKRLRCKAIIDSGK